MEMNPAEWQSRLEAVSLKQLILLYEMSKLTQSIGSEEGHPCGPNLDIDIQSQHPASFRRTDERQSLTINTNHCLLPRTVLLLCYLGNLFLGLHDPNLYGWYRNCCG